MGALVDRQRATLRELLDAARAEGMNARETAVFVATSYIESSWDYLSVGDGGTSFGPFQHHIGGAGGPSKATAQAYANPRVSARERARAFKRAHVDTGAEAAGVQRPANPGPYGARVESVARSIQAGSFEPFKRLAPGAQDTASRPKWSPARDAIADHMQAMGLRHSSGDRTPAANSAAGGVPNSAHLSTRTDVWADDYVGGNLQAAAAWVKSHYPDVETLIHDAGSGVHLHVEGKSQAGPASGVSAAGGVSGSVSGATVQNVGLGGDIAGAFSAAGEAVGEQVIFAGVLGVAVLIGGALVVLGALRLTGVSAGDVVKAAATKGAA